MKNTKLLLSTLVAATALSASPAFADNLTWTGKESNVWDNETENWTSDLTSEAAAFSESGLDSATFASSGGTITLGDNISAMIVTISDGTWTIGNAESPSNDLTAVMLTNTTSGSVSISADTLDIAVVQSSSSGDLTLSGNVVDIARIINNGTGTITITTSDAEMDGGYNTDDNDVNNSVEGAVPDDQGDSTVAQITTNSGNIVIEGGSGKIIVSSITSTSELEDKGNITVSAGSVTVTDIKSSGVGNITITATTADITNITSSGTGGIKIATTGSGEDKTTITSISSTGSGDITIAAAEAEITNITSSGSGHIYIMDPDGGTSEVNITGTISSTGSGDIEISASKVTTSDIASDTGSIEISSATAVINGNVSSSGSIEISSATAVINGNVSSSGSIEISSADLTISGGVTSYNSVVISSAKAEITGTVEANSEEHTVEISSDSATVGKLYSNVGSITVSSGTTTASSIEVSWGGSLSISEGATVSVGTETTSGTFTNLGWGTLTVGGTLSILGDMTVEHGTLTVDGTLSISGKMTAEYPAVSGNGSVSVGSFSRSGDDSELSGDVTISVNKFAVDGDFYNSAAGTVSISGSEFTVGGTLTYVGKGTGGSDALTISSDIVSIGGDLSVSNTGTNTTISGSSLYIGGTFDYAAAHTLDVSSSTAEINNMVVSSSFGTLTISSANLTIGTLTSEITSSATLVISSGSATIDSLVSESANTITISSTEATIGSLATNSSGNITISAGTTTIGTISSTLDTVALSVSSGATAKIVGDSDAGSVTFTTGTLTQSGAGTLEISANSATIGTLTQSGAGTLEISAGTATIDTMSIDAGALTISGTSNLTVENLTMSVASQAQFSISDSAVVSAENITISDNTTTDLGGSSLTVTDTLYFTASHSLNISATTVDIGTLNNASTFGESKIESDTVNIGTLDFSAYGSNTSFSIASSNANIDSLVYSSSTGVDITISSGTTTIGTISSTLDDPAVNLSVSSGATAKIVGDANGSVEFDGTLTHSGSGTLELTADSLNITSLTSGAGDLIISSAEATIGTIDSASGSGVTHYITIASGANVTAGELTRSSGIINLDVEGVLTVAKDDESGASGMMYIGTSSNEFGNAQTITGSGTINAYGIEFRTGSSAVQVSVANLNIGEGGITRADAGDFEFTGNTTVGLYGTDSATITTNMWLNSSAGTTFNTEEGQEMTLTGDITGSYGLIKTGAGTLTLSGSGNNYGYNGGTVISAGKVVATTDSALGQGKVTIAAGAQLEISEGAVVKNAISLTLTSANQIQDVSVARVETGSATAVILGSGTFSTDDGNVIEIAIDSALVKELADQQSYEFYVAESSVNGISTESIKLSTDLLDKGYTVISVNDGILTICVPEPSMFGVLAGLGALALVATRRRRNRKAA